MAINIRAMLEQACREKFRAVAGDEIRKYAEQLKGLAGPAVEAAVKSVSAGSISIGAPTVSDTSAEIRLSITGDLHRDSLCPEKYSGVDNIVNLFEHGWNAKGAVHGVWHGNKVWSRSTRNAGNMLSGAVAAFNASTPGNVNATLLGPYA